MKEYSVIGNNSKTIMVRLPEDPVKSNLRLWDVGFISPENITYYRCDNCGLQNVVSGSEQKPPKVGVSITLYSGGDESVQYVCDCPHCDEIVFYDYLAAAEGIDPQFITFDETGKYKTPTPQSIEELLLKAKEGAKKDIIPTEKIEVAERWAGVIGYTIPPDKIEEIKTLYFNVRLSEYQNCLPETIEGLLGFESEWSLSLFDDSELSAYEGSGLSDRMDELLEYLPRLQITDPNLKSRVVEVLDLYQNMFKEHKAELEGERDQLNARIAGAEHNLQLAQSLVKRLKQGL